MICPYCKSIIPKDAVVCRYCGRSLEVQPPRQPRSAGQSELDGFVRGYEAQGWTVDSGNETTVTMVRPKQVNLAWLIVWLLVALAFTPLTLGGSLIVYAIYYFLFVHNKRDSIVLSVTSEGRVRADYPPAVALGGKAPEGRPVDIKRLVTTILVAILSLMVICYLAYLALRALTGG